MPAAQKGGHIVATLKSLRKIKKLKLFEFQKIVGIFHMHLQVYWDRKVYLQPSSQIL